MTNNGLEEAIEIKAYYRIFYSSSIFSDLEEHFDDKQREMT